MSLELEQIIKQCLDGTFTTVCWHTGKVNVRKVAVDYKPNHHAHSNANAKNTGARNARAKPWTRELDAKLIETRNSGEAWPRVAYALGRSPSNCAIRYRELCKAMGMRPAPNVCSSTRRKERKLLGLS